MKATGGKLFRNTTYNIAGFLLESLGTIILIPYVIARLGLDVFGLVAAILTISISAQMLAQAVAAATIRQVARVSCDVVGLKRLFLEIKATRVGLCIVIVVSLVMSGFALAARKPFINWLGVPDNLIATAKTSLIIVALFLPLMLFGNYLTAIIRGRQEFGVANRIKVIATTVKVAGIIAIFEFFGPNPQIYVFFYASMLVFEGLLAFIWLRTSTQKTHPIGFETIDQKEFDRSTIRIIGGLLLFTLGNILVIEVSKILVGQFYGLESIGIFGAAAMAMSFLQRLLYAAAVALNPAVSELEATNRVLKADEITLNTALVTIAACGAGAVLTFSFWFVIAPLWLQHDVGFFWVVPGILFAAQGTVSSISPMVQGAYGRGRVIRLSTIHVVGSGLTVLLAYMCGVGGCSFTGMVVVIAGGRVLTALASSAYLGLKVFETWTLRNVQRTLIGMSLPWAGVAALWWIMVRFPTDLAALISASVAASIGLFSAWKFLLFGTIRQEITQRSWAGLRR